MKVSDRHLALPLADHERLTSFAERDDACRRVALDLAEEATPAALGEASLSPADVGHILFVTTAGIATPGG